MWKQIQGNLNPADLASRGLKCSQLKNQHLVYGQKLLRQMLNFNPETVSTEIDPQDPEVKVVKTVLSKTTV